MFFLDICYIGEVSLETILNDSSSRIRYSIGCFSCVFLLDLFFI